MAIPGTPSTPIPCVGFISLGCPKATVDSERILTRLRAEGYRISPSYDQADLVIVNTCGFIDAAIEESLDAIGEALTENGRVIVTGCLGARQDVVRAAHPKVLAVTGPHAADEVMDLVHDHLPKAHDPFDDLVPPAGIRLTPPHFAYLKISEGCNHRCTFCIIPSLRGPLQSRPIDQILQEAEALVASGAKELLLIAQDTGAYGVDVHYRTAFHNGRPIRMRLVELAAELAKLDVWVRLHYVYPYPSIDALLPMMAEGKLLPYLDVPFQHASPKILRAMQRPAMTETNLERVRAWRTICPELTIRSTFITGFPGETEQDFEELLVFLQEAQLDRVGAFAFSPVAGAVASSWPDLPPEAVREERRERLMELQASISADRLAARIGKKVVVLVDAIDEEGIIARSSGEAPEIDGQVYLDPFSGMEQVAVGDFIEVNIVDADDHDLFAEPVWADEQ